MKNLSSKKTHFPKNINTLKNQEDRDINEKMINHTLRKKIHENPSKGLEFRTLTSLPPSQKEWPSSNTKRGHTQRFPFGKKARKTKRKRTQALDQTRKSAMAF